VVYTTATQLPEVSSIELISQVSSINITSWAGPWLKYYVYNNKIPDSELITKRTYFEIAEAAYRQNTIDENYDSCLLYKSTEKRPYTKLKLTAGSYHFDCYASDRISSSELTNHIYSTQAPIRQWTVENKTELQFSDSITQVNNMSDAYFYKVSALETGSFSSSKHLGAIKAMHNFSNTKTPWEVLMQPQPGEYLLGPYSTNMYFIDQMDIDISSNENINVSKFSLLDSFDRYQQLEDIPLDKQYYLVFQEPVNLVKSTIDSFTDYSLFNAHFTKLSKNQEIYYEKGKKHQLQQFDSNNFYFLNRLDISELSKEKVELTINADEDFFWTIKAMEGDSESSCAIIITVNKNNAEEPILSFTSYDDDPKPLPAGTYNITVEFTFLHSYHNSKKSYLDIRSNKQITASLH